MALFQFALLLSLLFFSSIANLPKLNSLIHQINHTLDDETPPTVYSEVIKPINLPNTKPYTHQILQHQFAHTHDNPLLIADYNPPVDLLPPYVHTIVLELAATCNGNQLPRILGVWLDGVELLRSSTPKALPNGAKWSVKKDVTRYHSLLLPSNKKEPQQLAVYLLNIVDHIFTGVYDVTITLYFYPSEKKPDRNSNYYLGNRADMILPISRDSPVDDHIHGLWFEIKTSSDFQSKKFNIPQNAYKAVLEVYLSFHENDEFWYANYDVDMQGNGPFREVVVNLDDELVGVIWPFTVVYSEGINPYFWRPITGIGSFNLPTYDIDITPFLGKMVNGGVHEFSFGVTNALNVWYIDANLHLWLDHNSLPIRGELLTHVVPPTKFVDEPTNVEGINGDFKKTASRSISSSGWVQSSHGNITSHFSQNFDYVHLMSIKDEGNFRTIDQLITFDEKSHEGESPSSNAFKKSSKKFNIFLEINDVDYKYSNAYLSALQLLLTFSDKKSKHDRSVSSFESVQKANGNMVVRDGVIVRGSGSTKQELSFEDVDVLYTRNVLSEHNSIVYDKENVDVENTMSIH